MIFKAAIVQKTKKTKQRVRGRQTYKTDKRLTGGSRIYLAFYIILLDNFMGPTLRERKEEEREREKANRLKAVHCGSAPPFTLPSPPCDLPQLGLFYADLPGERMGTAAALCWRTEGGKKGGQKLENRGGGERGPVFVAFGRAELQFSH